MTEAAQRREPDSTTPNNPAGIIYGVLAIATVIAAEGTRRETFPKLLGASAIALALYWLAHAYARHLGSRFRQPAAWDFDEVLVSLAHEATILVGAVLPLAALVGAWLAGARVESGVTAALWCAGVELVVLEVAAGLRRKQRLRDTVVETGIGIAMGLGILAIRLLLH
jgi:hypothetical protein